MMYAFGKEIHSVSEISWDEVSRLKKMFARTKLNDIIETLDAFSKKWAEGSELFDEALALLGNDADTYKTLSLVAPLLSKDSLEKRLRGEFQNLLVLDDFTKLPGQLARVKAKPLGSLLHVTAGNVFLGCLDSLVMGLLTKNVSLVKVSSQNLIFPNLFVRKLFAFDQHKILGDKIAILHWKGGDKTVETVLKSRVNGIIAWGGEEMVESYRRELPLGVKLLDFGPKVSFQLLTKEAFSNLALDEIARRIVDDIIPWNQTACSSPQNLFIQEGVSVEPLLDALEKEFKIRPKRSELSDDEYTEILKEKYRAFYSKKMEAGSLRKGDDYLIHFERNPILRPSPLNRSLLVKPFKDIESLSDSLVPFSYYLQSCSYACAESEREELLDHLSLVGIKRFAPLGTITWGMEGAPHDGRFVLRELVEFIGDERRVTPMDASVAEPARFDLPGYIFSSGGTTGEPKISHFSYEDFDFVTDMLAQNFRAQGIGPGMRVANLFVAGNLWSSFIAVDRALQKVGVIQLPIGGLSQVENILSYLERFQPDVVMGIPSLIVSYAEAGLKLSKNLVVPKVFYAGEALSETRRDFLSSTWGTKTFGSAGYASVDAGVIGYQCNHCLPGEHHLFSDLVDLEIENEEAIVTSVARSSMMIRRHRTGDRVELLPSCSCGRKDQKFKLLGRVDSVIQIWSCRLTLEDLEKTFREQGLEIRSYQLILTDEREHNLPAERLHLTIEHDQEIDTHALLMAFYENSRDLRDTISFDRFVGQTTAVVIGSGEIPKNPRTGKISLVKDLRK